jgi:hypothetical protein
MNPEAWQQMRQILEPPLELDPVSRSAFVDHVCAGEVRFLLAQHRQGEDPLEQPAVEVVGRHISRFSPSQVL